LIQRWSGSCDSAQADLSLASQLDSSRLLAIRGASLFEELSSAQMAKVISSGFHRRLYKRETLFTDGEPVRYVFLLIAGRMKQTLLAENGSELILRLNSPGEVVGEFTDVTANYGSTAQAMETSEVVVWRGVDFISLAERLPTLRRNQTKILSRRLEEMHQRFSDLSSCSTAPRLAHLLTRLLQPIGHIVREGIELNLSQQELGQLIGANPCTVSRLLSSWEKQGIVSGRRQSVVVLSVEALRELCAAD
jgi:CRP-like cAMP-binding protein